MIIGYFRLVGATLRPFIRCDIAFPEYPDIAPAPIEFVVDTGSDTTVLSPDDAVSLGLQVDTLDVGQRMGGVGSQFPTRIIESRITVQDFYISHLLRIPEIDHPMPSLLGRDFMRGFALFMEERTERVFLLEPSDLDNFRIPSLR